jgi:hypothetical protein
MKKNKLLRLSLLPLAMLAISVVFIFSGCMESTVPDDATEFVLNARVYRTTNGKAATPVRGATVTVMGNDENTNINQNVITNDQGIAQFNLNVPLVGSNLRVLADYNGQQQSKTGILLCRDTLVIFLFDNTRIDPVSCGNLDGSALVQFTDDNGSTELRQNTPAGISRYERCTNITNSLQGSETITASNFAAQAPFELIGLYLDGASMPLNSANIPIAPGSSLAVCYSVSTEAAGDFNQTIPVRLACQNETGIFIIELQATVVAPDCDCESIPTPVTLELLEPVEVGKSAEISGVVFVNELACDVEITQVEFDGSNVWQILSPTEFPISVARGQSLTVSARYTANAAEVQLGLLQLVIVPNGTAEACPLDVYLSGRGCANSCPLISMDRIFFDPFTEDAIEEILSNRDDDRIFISVTDVSPPILTTVTETYYIMNPDSNCSLVEINIVPQYADQYAQEFYEINPQNMILAPGEIGAVSVTFTAPIRSRLEQIVGARGNNGTVADSSFEVRLQISGSGCRQDIDVTAIVTSIPDISPIINLRAFAQSTAQKPDPEHEVYVFGESSRRIEITNNSTPTIGNIWIDVEDNSEGAKPPQEPIIKLVNPTITMKLWRNNYPEADFTNVLDLIQEFESDGNHSTGYSTDPITGIAVGDVIAVQFGANVYALMYIRRVDNGTEQTSSKQSGIEFRAIYPIYIP